MIFGCTFAPVNLAVAILVNKLYVAWSIYECTALERSLIGYTILVNPLAISILTIEVVEIEVAVGFEAPDFAIFLTGVISVGKVVAVPLSYFCLVVALSQSSS